jgi:hypothetical protein
MSSSVTDAVSSALPIPGATPANVDLRELQGELDRVAAEALQARSEGLGLAQAVRDPGYPALARFHQDLRDAMFVEIPANLRAWVENLYGPRANAQAEELGTSLTHLARGGDDDGPANADLQQALAELLVFESVRLRLLVAAWQSEDFERLGGEEADVDAIAWEEIQALLDEPLFDDGAVRPLQVMYAAASVSLARDAHERADALRRTGEDLREQLSMRARLRAALRELRLAESVLLENALANLLGEERLELQRLQDERPVALEGMTRQAMDQRVSRGRRALIRPGQAWPRRRNPALFDLLRGDAQ